MELKALDKIGRTFSVELPYFESLEEGLDFVIPAVQPWGEDLKEMEFYVQPGGKPWLEIRDDESFHEAVLHFFNTGGEYLQSVDGNVSRGKWRLLDGTNKIIIEQGNKVELFELAFLSEFFFLLKKHGNQHRKGKKKYLILGFEPHVTGLEWRDFVELLFNTYRRQQGMFRTIIILFLILVAIIVLFSIF